MDYKTLAALAAEAYLDPSLFSTAFDALESVKERGQYEKGIRVSREAFEITISVNSVWCASMRDGSHLSSDEGIGYHSGTADLLRGFLAGPAALVVFRTSKDASIAITTTIVKPHQGFEPDVVAQRLAALQKAHGEIKVLS